MPHDPPAAGQSAAYRTDIDGLRAFAVLPVILFHAGFDAFPGGFVGVDVFFVISGFLITSIILREAGEGRFSLARFYERRARRILPALFLVLAACIPFAWAWMLPAQLEDFGSSLVAVCLFVSNIWFWLGTGYFEPAGELKPLLHTWSLAVEEQYYLLFPLALVFGLRFGLRRLVWGMAAVAALSLALSEIGQRIWPAATFYLLPARAWELLAGALAATHLRDRPQRETGWLCGLGLGMILAAVFVYDERTPFPSAYALLPVVGAVLVILHGGRRSAAGRVLCAPPVVWVGLVSYSAYLWHQPLFAFARIHSIFAPSPWVMGGLSLASLLLAWGTWAWVERPFRAGPHALPLTRPAIFRGAFVGGAVLAAAGLGIAASGGAPQRLSPETLEMLAAAGNRNPSRGACHYTVGLTSHGIPPLPVPACVFGPDPDHIQVAILGDSHAEAIAYPLLTGLAERGLTATQITLSGCAPFAGYRLDYADCDAANRAVEAYVARSGIEVVILAARSQALFMRERFDNGEGGVEAGLFSVAEFLPGAVAETSKTLPERGRDVIAGTVRRYLAMGKRVILVHPIPEAGWDVPLLSARLAMRGELNASLSTSEARFRERNAPVEAALSALEDPGLTHVRPAEVLCGRGLPGRCVNVVGGRALYADDDHLSNAGAALIAPGIIAAAEAAVADARREGAMR